MSKKLITFALLLIVSGAFYFLNQILLIPDGQRIFDSLGSITLMYFIFKVIIEVYVSERFSDLKARYSVRKISSILFFALSIVVLIRIWTVDPQTILISYGLVAAGVTVALQDVLKILLEE